jgi:hypothetical protein
MSFYDIDLGAMIDRSFHGRKRIILSKRNLDKTVDRKTKDVGVFYVRT